MRIVRGKSVHLIRIEIKNWKKYNKRKDYKNPWWFALSNKITTDPMFSEFTDAEFKTWIHILCTGSVQNSYRIDIFPAFFQKNVGIEIATLFSAIKKLEIVKAIQVLEEICTDPVQNLYSTEQNRTIHTPIIPEGDSLIPVGEKEKCPKETHPLMEIWNNNRESLPEAKALSAKRLKSCKKRWAECSDPDQWAAVVRFLATDKFFSGQGESSWIASFDYLIKPDTRIKIIERIERQGPKTKSEDHWI